MISVDQAFCKSLCLLLSFYTYITFIHVGADKHYFFFTFLTICFRCLETDLLSTLFWLRNTRKKNFFKLHSYLLRPVMVNVLKFRALFSFCSQTKCWFSALGLQYSKQGRPGSDSLIWVCTVCLGIFGRQLVYETLEHLLYQ